MPVSSTTLVLSAFAYLCLELFDDKSIFDMYIRQIILTKICDFKIENVLFYSVVSYVRTYICIIQHIPLLRKVAKWGITHLINFCVYDHVYDKKYQKLVLYFIVSVCHDFNMLQKFIAVGSTMELLYLPLVDNFY